jgi:hypothetical protein
MCVIADDEKINRSEDTTWSTYENETIVLNLETGMYFTLNPVASILWDALDGNRALPDLVAFICREYEVDPSRAEKDIRSILEFFKENSLIN